MNASRASIYIGGLLMLMAALPSTAAGQNLVLSAARAYLAPDAAPIDDALIVVRDGKISAVGPRAQLQATSSAADSVCAGGVVMAGFQNSHVHLLGEGYFGAKSKASNDLAGALERMLTRFGYTTVVDTASDPANTNVIRQRIEAGEIVGPRILTVGAGVFPPHGLPIYIAHLPRRFLDAQLTPDSTTAARRLVQQNIDAGADATKLFVATPQADSSLKRMSLEIARAAVDASHARNKLVLVHPTDVAGVRFALDAGADILVHTTLGSETPWPTDVLERLLAEGIAISPTFKLLGYELRKENVPESVANRLIAASIEHFKPFVASGGAVLFGTDVGYMTDDNPTDEYVLMQRAGMTPMQILASLTTEPARVWKEHARRGTIEVGKDADLVVLRADPSEDVRRFADVRCAIRAGRRIYGE